METSKNPIGELFPMRLLGLGLYFALPAIWASFEQDIDVASLSSPILRFCIISGLCVILYLGFAIYVHVTGHSPWNTRSVIICGICSIVYPGLEFAAIAASSFALDLCAIVVRTVAVVCLFLMWNVQLANYKAKTAWTAYAGSMVLASLLCFLISALGTVMAVVAIFALPLGSCLLLVLSRAMPMEDGEIEEEEAANWKIPWRPIILAAVFCFADSLVSHYVGDTSIPAEYGRLAAAAIILLCILVAFNRFDFNLIVKICPAFVVAALLVCGIHGFDDSFGLGKLLASIGYNAFLLYLYFALNTICYRYKAHAEWLFGTVEAVCNILIPLGALLGDRLLTANLESQWLLVDTAMGATVVAVVLLSMLLMTGSTLNDTWGIRAVRVTDDENGAQKGQLTTDGYLKDLVYRCALIARQYGLTHREEEVLSLLAEGKSFQEIEDALCIAHGTLRVHVRHIYTKLDVHSAEEARDFIMVWNGR